MSRSNLILSSILVAVVLVAGSLMRSDVSGSTVALAHLESEASAIPEPGDLPTPIRVAKVAASEVEASSRSEVALESPDDEVALAPGPARVRSGMQIVGSVWGRGLEGTVFEVSCRRAAFDEKTTTDALGMYQMHLPGPGTYWFTVRGAGHHLMQSREIIRGVSQSIDFEFDGGQVAGWVVGSRGEALEGIQVHLKWAPDDHEQVRAYKSQAVTDLAGHFRFDQVPAAKFLLTVSASESNSVRWLAYKGDAFEILRGGSVENIEIRLDPAKEPSAQDLGEFEREMREYRIRQAESRALRRRLAERGSTRDW